MYHISSHYIYESSPLTLCASHRKNTINVASRTVWHCITRLQPSTAVSTWGTLFLYSFSWDVWDCHLLQKSPVLLPSYWLADAPTGISVILISMRMDHTGKQAQLQEPGSHDKHQDHSVWLRVAMWRLTEAKEGRLLGPEGHGTFWVNLPCNCGMQDFCQERAHISCKSWPSTSEKYFIY